MRAEIVVMGMGAVLQNRACSEVAEAVFEASSNGPEQAMIAAAAQKCAQATQDTMLYAEAAMDSLDGWDEKACSGDAGVCSGTAGKDKARALEGCLAKTVEGTSAQYISAANFLKVPLVAEYQDAMTMAARRQDLAPNSGCDHLLDE